MSSEEKKEWKVDVVINKDEAYALVIRNYLDDKTASNLFDVLVKEVTWLAKEVKVFNKIYIYICSLVFVLHVPILILFMNILVFRWTLFQGKCIKAIKDNINSLFEENYKIKAGFNSSLINYYHNGDDYIAAHSDREAGGFVKAVASVSLGGTRRFYFKSKKTSETIKTELNNGDLCLMFGKCQDLYTHTVPKQKGVKGRIAITFRHLENTSNK